MAAYKAKNHPRILRAHRTGAGVEVQYMGRVPKYEERIVERTTGKNGQLLKKPVKETRTVQVGFKSGVVSQLVQRHKTLRKMGVRVVV